MHTTLIMACRQHAMFNHDDVHDFALNFTAPLLIECGSLWMIIRDLLYMGKAEKENICQNKFSHKSLAGICRDVLRRHFKGSAIHRFVKYSNIPSKIKDFILLKDILKYSC